MLMTPSHDGGRTAPASFLNGWRARLQAPRAWLSAPTDCAGDEISRLVRRHVLARLHGLAGLRHGSVGRGRRSRVVGLAGAGIGIPCGLIGGLDLDILDAEACLVAYELAGKALGPPSPTASAWRPAAHSPPDGRAVREGKAWADGVPGPRPAVRRLRHPSRHATTYRWPVEELSDIPFAELPIVTEQQVRAFMAAAYERLPPALRTKAPERDRSGEVYYARGAISAVRGRPRPQPSSISRSAMTAMTLGSSSGLAIKGSVGDRGLELWDRWSRQSTKYKPGECARRWAMPSFTPRDVGWAFVHAGVRGRVAAAEWRLIFSQERADQLAGLVEHRAQPWLDRIKAAQESNFDPETGEVIEGEIAVMRIPQIWRPSSRPRPSRPTCSNPAGCCQELMVGCWRRPSSAIRARHADGNGAGRAAVGASVPPAARWQRHPHQRAHGRLGGKARRAKSMRGSAPRRF